MPWKNSDSRYSTVSIALHWLMLVLLVVVYATIELRGIFPKGSGGRTLIKEAHFMLGLTVFVLVWLRLFARSLGVAPKIIPAPPQWQSLMATLMHIALYVFMIGMPILGWMTTSAAGNQVMFYGIDLPLLMSENKELAKQLQTATAALVVASQDKPLDAKKLDAPVQAVEDTCEACHKAFRNH